MKITLLEPFFTGSHQQWAEGLQVHSQHDIELLTLKGKFWKWRMHGGAITLARLFNQEAQLPDLVLASDMLDLSTFKGLAKPGTYRTALYFHENQLTYPWSPTDQDKRLGRDTHYGFINLASALAADRIFFNSLYHQTSFLNALPDFLKQFPDYQELECVAQITRKSQVLPLGMRLERFNRYRSAERENSPVILWNHRWEYDKNPAAFFEALYHLQESEVDFRVVVLGEAFERSPAVFEAARVRLADHILHWGYVETFQEYAYWLWKADILPVTAIQDFFGGSTVEAIYCDCYPVLPQRLAYQEHIPPSLHTEHLYQDEEDLGFFLEHLILNIERIRKKHFQPFVAKYDWSARIADYDLAFESLALV